MFNLVILGSIDSVGGATGDGVGGANGGGDTGGGGAYGGGGANGGGDTGGDVPKWCWWNCYKVYGECDVRICQFS